MSQLLRIIQVLALCSGAAALVCGCTRTIAEGEMDTAFTDRSTTAVLDYWHTLPGRSIVTNAQGLHGILLFADGEDQLESYEARVEELHRRGWLVHGFDEPANMAMSRGTLAKALTHAMDIDGGVMMRLTNKSPRYATMELLYLAIVPPSTSQQVISGLDYVGVIAKAQDYLTLREARQLERDRLAAREAADPDADAAGDSPEPAK